MLMTELPPTRASLVLRLRDASDREAWETLVTIYAPVILNYARRCGLAEPDAEDLVQDVLQSVHGAVDKFGYDPQKGTFRGWLFTISRNRIHNLRKRNRRSEMTGGTVVRDMVHAAVDPVDDQEDWNLEHQKQLFQWAVGQVQSEFRPTTWKAFWATAVENRSPESVAESLGLTTGAVYVAKSRVTSRIRGMIESVERE
jgi:RNA polymerase sigma-70 factor (ECF subfamily)